jgi:hypothetical protein
MTSFIQGEFTMVYDSGICTTQYRLEANGLKYSIVKFDSTDWFEVAVLHTNGFVEVLKRLDSLDDAIWFVFSRVNKKEAIDEEDFYEEDFYPEYEKYAYKS